MILRRYDSAIDLTPSPWTAVGTAISIFLLSQLSRSTWIPDWLPLSLVIGAGLVLVFWVLPAWLHWQIALFLAHREKVNDIRITNSDVLLYKLKNDLADKQIRLSDRLLSMNNDQLQVMLTVPGVPEIDLSPEGLDFLVLALTRKRVPMSVVREVGETWVRLVGKGRNPYLLPSVRMWSESRKRTFVIDLYKEMYETGLIKTFAGDSWHAGNITATVASDVMPVDVFRWMRLEQEFDLSNFVEEINEDGENSD
jgi:hypothetical protein